MLFVQSKFDEDNESYPFLNQIFSGQHLSRSPSVPTCFSSRKIKFVPEVDQSQMVRNDGIRSLLPLDENGIFEVMPAAEDWQSSRCSRCSSKYSDDCPKERGWVFPNIKLYLFNTTIICNGKIFYHMFAWVTIKNEM